MQERVKIVFGCAEADKTRQERLPSVRLSQSWLMLYVGEHVIFRCFASLCVSVCLRYVLYLSSVLRAIIFSPCSIAFLRTIWFLLPRHLATNSTLLLVAPMTFVASAHITRPCDLRLLPPHVSW